MYKSSLSYKTALLLALSISVLMNLFFLIMFVYGRDAVLPPEGLPHGRPQLKFENILFNFISNFILTFILYLLNFRLLKVEIFHRSRWFLLVLLTLVCTVIISYALSAAHLQLYNFGLHPDRFIRGSMFRDCILAIFVILSSQLIYLTNKQQQASLEYETLQAENIKTRFLALKNQVDPHFLFNSLNTLNSLIKIDADKAQEYVQQLSSVFRYTLQNKDNITLEEELKFTMAYCHLMQIRYGDSLSFEKEIDEKYYGYSIIPLSLQILVENAIKHNVVSKRQPLKITFSTSENKTVSVSNPVQLKKETESGESIGLSNLSERYRLIWKKDIEIEQTGRMFIVRIPLIG